MKFVRIRKMASDNQGWKRGYRKIEEAQHIEYVKWLKENYDVTVIHVPNEGHCKPQYRKKLLAMGLCPGVNDLIVLWTNNILWHEIKSTEGALSKKQKDFHKILISYGFKTETTYGLDEAKSVPDKYYMPKRVSLQIR